MNVVVDLKLSPIIQKLIDDGLPAFTIALFSSFEMIENQDITLLNYLPKDVKAEVLGIVNGYKKNNEFVVLSSAGMVDHTPTAKALYELFVRDGVTEG